MTAHTPAPWRIDASRPTQILTKDGDIVARAYDGVAAWNPTSAWMPGEANARLIAAAPDLLVALEAILGWCGSDDGYHALPFEPPWVDEVCAAVRKARGQE
jgi:hypothetical protein